MIYLNTQPSWLSSFPWPTSTQKIMEKPWSVQILYKVLVCLSQVMLNISNQQSEAQQPNLQCQVSWTKWPQTKNQKRFSGKGSVMLRVLAFQRLSRSFKQGPAWAKHAKLKSHLLTCVASMAYNFIIKSSFFFQSWIWRMLGTSGMPGGCIIFQNY